MGPTFLGHILVFFQAGFEVEQPGSDTHVNLHFVNEKIWQVQEHLTF